MIEQKPFCLYARCSVVYEGRASSLLDVGRYLVVYKKDGSVMIHGADSLVPRNYMGAKSRVVIEANVITFVRKSEKIVVTMDEVISLTYLDSWSESKTQICRTERELTLKIFDNWFEYLPDSGVELIHLEYPTALGPIDVMGEAQNETFIIEVKRRKGSIKDVTQLRRYVEAMENGGRPIKGFLAAPDCAKGALDYLKKHGLEYLPVNF